MIWTIAALAFCGLVLFGAGFVAGWECLIWRTRIETEAGAEADEWTDALRGLPPEPPRRRAVQPSDIIGTQTTERDGSIRTVLFSRGELATWMPDLERCDPAAQPDTEGWTLSGDTWLPPMLGGRRPGDPLSQLLWRAALMPAGPPALEAPTAASEPEEGTDAQAAE